MQLEFLITKVLGGMGYRDSQQPEVLPLKDPVFYLLAPTVSSPAKVLLGSYGLLVLIHAFCSVAWSWAPGGVEVAEKAWMQ